MLPEELREEPLLLMVPEELRDEPLLWFQLPLLREGELPRFKVPLLRDEELFDRGLTPSVLLLLEERFLSTPERFVEGVREGVADERSLRDVRLSVLGTSRSREDGVIVRLRFLSLSMLRFLRLSG